MKQLTLSIVIPTLGREKVMLQTLEHHLRLSRTTKEFLELILLDQTQRHDVTTEQCLSELNNQKKIRWLRLKEPHLTRSMNLGLMEARGDVVLFTDDDIIPISDLLNEHLAVYYNNPDVCAVVGQILQPGEQPENISFASSGNMLTRYLDFPFRRTQSTFIENAIACNFSLIRKKGLMLGGFDERFIPPVAFRFETEFAKRLVANGGKIWFEAKASVRHLHYDTGGTRIRGGHLNSMSPRYGVGDYYYAMRHGKGWPRLWYIFHRPFREVRTKYHLKHPWWIPLKFIGELLAIVKAVQLYLKGPKLMHFRGNSSNACP
jgi:GT2 family glycosyltransferase